MADDQYIKVLEEKIKELKIELDSRNTQLTNKVKELAAERKRADKLKAENEELESKNFNLQESNTKYSEDNASLKERVDWFTSRKHYDSETIAYEGDNQVFQAFCDNASILNLNYSEEELINFYTAVKSSKMTVLEGISGTGKSKLVSLYGKTLGLDVNSQMKMVPVSPSWTDDTDILGFLDASSNEYKESAIGLVSFLLEAERHPSKPYLLCFDEMNLAKVEYYFAQFISVLENDLADRKLTLYNPKLQSKVKNAQDYPATIKLGNNLIICGTINVDESTYRLSDKVLDRACLIKLAAPDLKNIDIGIPENAKIKVVEPTIADVEIKPDLTVKEIEVISGLNEILTLEASRFGVAYRVLNQIGRFLACLPSGDLTFTREEALDRMIVQKILSKVRGTQDQIKNLVGKIENGKYVSGSIDSYLNVDNNISYPEVRKALEEKAKELNRYGYVG